MAAAAPAAGVAAGGPERPSFLLEACARPPATRSASPRRASTRDMLTGLTDVLERLAVDGGSGPDGAAGHEAVALDDVPPGPDSPGPSTGGLTTPAAADDDEQSVVSFGQQAFATLTSLFVGDTWSTTGWAWSECSARPPKELPEGVERVGNGAAADRSRTDDDTPSSSAVLTVISLADGGDASWPDANDQSSSFLEAALRVLCCRAPGPDHSAAAIYIGADDAGEQCTFHRTFDAGGGLAALQELDELSAECARTAIRARIGMSQPERLAADRLLEEHRAALLGGTAVGDASAAPSGHVADLLADLPSLGDADDGVDVQQSLAKLERRCITGIATTTHRALRLLLTAAPKQSVASAELRAMLQSALADINALHAAFGDRLSRLEGDLGGLAAGEESPGRVRARAAREEMESARSQAQAVLMRAAALTVFVLVVGQLKPAAAVQP